MWRKLGQIWKKSLPAVWWIVFVSILVDLTNMFIIAKVHPQGWHDAVSFLLACDAVKFIWLWLYRKK